MIYPFLGKLFKQSNVRIFPDLWQTRKTLFFPKTFFSKTFLFVSSFFHGNRNKQPWEFLAPLHCKNFYIIVQSNLVITNTVITNLVITNSVITNLVITNTVITNSVIINLVITNSVIMNSFITNLVITNSVITNSVIKTWLQWTGL